ncbi:MAG: flagellar basal-body MS-ring/collar protein FliF [Paracoccaceae bacterium]
MNPILSRLSLSWGAMEPRRKAVFAISLIALAVALSLFVRIVSSPTMALLYSGLDGAAASGVIEGLEREGVPYEVRGDAIFVPSDSRDKARITLAGQGLPAAGAAGYELLDGLSGFGTTAEMFDAAYWRAKEGELARTILASHRVIRARVHIAQVKRRPFERENAVTASVTVSTSSGALSRNQAEAIRYLVASAVAGLALQNVAVIDQENGVILRSGEAGSEAGAGDDDAARAATLEASVTRLLEARVGSGAAIVEVTVATVRESETLRERLLDPSGRVAIHTDTEESTDAANGDAGAVTVASNLADGDVEGGGDGAKREAARTRERVNFEVSETVRETMRPAGGVERITVAVLVDGVKSADADADAAWAPRPEAELETLRELVETAVGFDEARGDRVTIRSMEFNETAQLGTVAESGFGEILAANAMSLIQIATLGLVALMLGLFVVRPILSVAGPQNRDDADYPLLSVGGPGGEALSIPPGDMIDAEALNVDRRALLESAVADKQDEAVRLLGLWLDEETEAAEAA